MTAGMMMAFQIRCICIVVIAMDASLKQEPVKGNRGKDKNRQGENVSGARLKEGNSGCGF